MRALDLILWLSERLEIKCFIETGTGPQASTARLAAQHFERVITIEGSRSVYNKAKRALADADGTLPENIHLMLGRSPDRLPAAFDEIKDERAIVYLDAWAIGEDAIEDEECPLLDELEAIEAIESEHVIILPNEPFLTAPPPGADVAQWPERHEVLRLLQPGRKRFYGVVDGVIIALPDADGAAVMAYLAKKGANAPAASG